MKICIYEIYNINKKIYYNLMGLIFTEILTRDDFKKILRSNIVTIVKASAEWCGPCKKIKEYVGQLFDLTSSNVQIVYLDVDEGDDLSTYLRIRKLPTFISFVGDDRMDVLEGADPEDVRKFFCKVEARAKLLKGH